jgi:hypothetical protein
MFNTERFAESGCSENPGILNTVTGFSEKHRASWDVQFNSTPFNHLAYIVVSDVGRFAYYSHG